jgi:hypothetical protein
MNELIEWRPNDNNDGRGNDVWLGFHENGNVASIVKHEVFYTTVLGNGGYFKEAQTLEAAKSHAESLYRAHLISVLKKADGELLAEANLVREIVEIVSDNGKYGYTTKSENTGLTDGWHTDDLELVA